MWRAHRRNPALELYGQLDYYGKLSAQMPPASLRVVYPKSGTLPASAFVDDGRSLIENKLYWCAVEGIDEARFMVAVLNSEATRAAVADRQSRGQWGARDFDKLLAEAIPEFDAKNAGHRELVQLAEKAEEIAAGVELVEGINFIRARQIIREALRESGVAKKIDQIVARVLGN